MNLNPLIFFFGATLKKQSTEGEIYNEEEIQRQIDIMLDELGNILGSLRKLHQVLQTIYPS